MLKDLKESSGGAITEQFQCNGVTNSANGNRLPWKTLGESEWSSFGAVSEQFQSNFGLILN